LGEKLKNRVFVSLVIFCFLFLIVVVKAFYIQVVNKEKLLAYARSQFTRTIKEYPNRGNIVDRNGHPLAINVHVYNIATFPKKNSSEYRDEIKSLSKIIPSLSYSKINSLIRGRTKFTWLIRNITLNDDQLKAIKKLKSISVESLTKRVYPNKELLSQTLGFVGVDNTGLAGIENSKNELLKGKPITVKYIRDAKGRPIKYEDKKDENLVPDLQLSMDKDLQGALESYLREAVVHHKAKRGGAAVMDAETGEILAISNYPTFDPNLPSQSSFEFKKLAFVTDPFEPGSTFKAITIASALEHKVATPETKYFCEYGKLKVQNHWVSEAESHEKFEWLTVKEILKHSSNVGTTKIAFNLKFPRLRETIEKFKLGSKTGIEINGESKGIVPFGLNQRVTPLSLSNISFGQGIATTALQMLRSYAVIANGGYLVKPTLLKNDSTQLVEENRILSEKTATDVQKMLLLAVDQGTGGEAKIPHYEIAGKTGTAQRVSSRGGYEGYIASFIGFPINVSKKFVVLVYVDHPKANGYYGGGVAAPVFKKITQYILYKKKDFSRFAKYNENSNKMNMDSVQLQLASSKKSVEPGQVPSFLGMDKSAALKLANERDIEIQTQGFGVVSRQSVLPGTTLTSDIKVKLYFTPPTYVE
jgi:cell division protein FtsI (penicillin-binding protein 3)